MIRAISKFPTDSNTLTVALAKDDIHSICSSLTVFTVGSFITSQAQETNRVAAENLLLLLVG